MVANSVTQGAHKDVGDFIMITHPDKPTSCLKPPLDETRVWSC